MSPQAAVTDSMMADQKASYIGRFAPSPTGPLHFGSLLSALASYIDARVNQGLWLVRMEDLDPPREIPGAAESILQSLQDHGLNWDGEILYQSERLDAYKALIDLLLSTQKAYTCDCNRARINSLMGVYDGHCRHKEAVTSPHAVRLRLDCALDNSTLISAGSFTDLFQGPYGQDLAQEVGDFIIHRKDGLTAYQLAVVADDIFQGITHIIRGSDLLDSSPRQCYLFTLLGAKPPVFGHIPVAMNEQGQKLSKQNLAPPIDGKKASHNLWEALKFLQQAPPRSLLNTGVSDILDWASNHWQPGLIPARLGLPAEGLRDGFYE